MKKRREAGESELQERVSCSSGREEIGRRTINSNTWQGQNRGKMTGGAAHLIGTGRGRVARETQNTRPVWRWVREGDGGAAAASIKGRAAR